jgi:hypothetical protein
MNTSQQMDTMTGQNDRQDMLNSPDPDTAPEGGDASTKTVLDMSVPEIADAFHDAEVGDTFKIASKDDSEVVLEKVPTGGGDEDAMQPEETAGSGEPDADDASMPKSDNPAVALIIARKNKR